MRYCTRRRAAAIALLGALLILPLAGCDRVREAPLIGRWIAADHSGIAAEIVHHTAFYMPSVAFGPDPVLTEEALAALEAHVAHLESLPRWDLSRWDTWMAVAECESGGDWHINTGNGYSGGVQFDASSWRGAGGTGYAWQASVEEQVHRANVWLRLTGWHSWPTCARRLGLL